MNELRLLGTLALLGLIGVALYCVSILVVMSVTVGVLVAGGAGSAAGSNHFGVFAIVAALMLTIISLMIIFQIRFMLALPLTLLRERIVVREAWARSRGHFWRLFGGVLLGGLTVATVSLIAFIPMLLLMIGSGDGLFALTDPARQIALMSSPVMYPVWLLTPLFGGFFVATTGGALAQALIETEAAG